MKIFPTKPIHHHMTPMTAALPRQSPRTSRRPGGETCDNRWCLQQLGGSINGGTPSHHPYGFSLINHLFWGPPWLWKPPISSTNITDLTVLATKWWIRIFGLGFLLTWILPTTLGYLSHLEMDFQPNCWDFTCQNGGSGVTYGDHQLQESLKKFGMPKNNHQTDGIFRWTPTVLGYRNF